MLLLNALATASALFASLAIAAPSAKVDKRYVEQRDGVVYQVFEHAETGAKLSYVKNSGICETTPGVNQYSGYLSVGSNMNMWFWFFEARNNPSTAPLASWFNGGPGCSSMIGLFQENGPCHFANGSSTPSLNPYSWNEYANMVYIDQPIGTGFSYGTDSVTSTVTAAPFVWKFLQAFYAQFTEYENRDFAIFTESYGGHYGPEFAYYLEQQNAAIAKGTVKGEKINLVALGINNGWTDPTISYKAYLDFSVNNTYNQIISSDEYDSYLSSYNDDCVPALQRCAKSGSNSDCSSAQNTCYSEIEGPISQEGDFDVYDVREPSNDPYPPSTYSTYLTNSAVVKAIGAKSTYTECSDSAGNKFSSTGDDSRSLLPALSSVVQSGIQVLIWAGDADWICNWMGNQAAAEAITFSGSSAFKNAAMAPYTVNGAQTGMFKTQDNLSFLRVYEAGHEVPYYQPATALQVFIQTMQKKAISPT